MKIKYLFLYAIVLSNLFLSVGCNGQGTSKATSSTNAKAADKGDYTLFNRVRLMDQTGFAQPVEALSVLIPENWSFDGGTIWTPPGGFCSGTNMGMKAVSPDSLYSFEMLPYVSWGFTSDPQIAQFSRQQQYPRYCGFGEPLNADAYFKQVFAPQELGNPTIISTKENDSGIKSLQENGEKSRQELMSYGASQVNFFPSGITANIKWNNNQEAIVLCGVTIMETVIPNIYNGTYTKSYTTVASERFVFMYPAGEYEKASKMMSAMVGSIRTNMAWKNSVDEFWKSVRTQSQINHIGKIKMMDELTRQIGENTIKAGQENSKRMDTQMRNWEASQQSQDRIHTNFVKAIREVETYRDETGVIELNSGYSNAWSRSDGSSFILSDNPNFDPSSVFQDQQWKQMKKVN